jgi:hypothetical protein
MGIDEDFDRLARVGRAIVEAHREKRGFEEGIRRLLSELYPDNAHFIYELLQNAEDAGASVVEFELRPDSLEVSHNGPRLFNLDDIDSITNIGDSTKKDDPTQIGKFGVGFKAVYSYTTRPEIRSGDFSFAIVDLFVPERIEGRAREGWTIFTFPFDRIEKPAHTACVEVERSLKELGEQTLLFLNNIRTITYVLPTGDVGIVERTDQSDLTISIETNQGEEFVESRWLRLVGPASVAHEGPAPLTVAVAFKIEADDPPRPKSGGQDGAPASEQSSTVVPLDHGDVSIYFPATKETSGLKFHIHAPFASTVARDSVRDDPGNDQLVQDIGDLLVANLPTFRDMGILDDSFLATLPNEDDPLAHPYALIRDSAVDAFNQEPVTPARGRGFGAARTLVSSPGEFRRLLRESDLGILLDLAGIETEEEPRWIRDRDGRAGKFLAGLETIKFGWRELGQALEKLQERQKFAWVNGKYVAPTGPLDSDLRGWLAWLDSKSDSELLDLYQLVGLGRSTHRLQSAIGLDTIPMVRLRRRGKAEHVKGRGTFLPASRSDSVQSRVPAELAYFEDEDDERANNLRAFYRAAGVERWNERARLEARLKEYAAGRREIPESEAEVEQHLDDVRAFVRFFKSDAATAQGIFDDAAFLLSPHPDGSLFWVSPAGTYLDVPYRATGLATLYEWTKGQWDDDDDESVWWDEPERYPVAGIYLDVEGIEEFLELAGAATCIEITPARVFGNPQFKREWRVNNRRSPYTEMRDWEINNLSDIVATADPTLLRTLWKAVVETPASRAVAVYQANRSAGRYTFESQLVQQLRSVAWVLDRAGRLRAPREISMDALPEEWERPSGDSLALEVGFGADADRQEQRQAMKPVYARQLGIDLDDVELLQEARSVGVSSEDIRELIAQKRSESAFPEGASEDPDRRSATAAADALAAPEYRTELRARSVAVGQGPASEESRSYLREQYTNNQGDMFCQACHGRLPFKVNGEWYFEAVQFVGGRKRVHRSNALAMCPLCAALYRYKRETKKDALLGALLGLDVEAGQGTIDLPVLVNERRVLLRFTGKHVLDLKTSMEAAGDERESP